MLSGFRIWHDRKNQRLQNNAEYCSVSVLSWTKAQIIWDQPWLQSVVCPQCLLWLDCLWCLDTGHTLLWYLSIWNELFWHPVNLNYRRDVTVRDITPSLSFTIFIRNFKLPFLTIFVPDSDWWRFRTSLKTQNAAIRGQNGQNYHVWWPLHGHWWHARRYFW